MTVGVVGTGLIGREGIKRLHGFEPRIVAYDVIESPEMVTRFGVEYVSFDELLRQSDVLTIHMVLSPKTRGLLGADELALMKTTSLLVNTSRGPLVDEAALVAALDAGHLGAAALDVVAVEPPARDSRLLGRDNVILTPHTAFYSVEALDELQTKCASDVARVLSGEPPVYPVKPG